MSKFKKQKDSSVPAVNTASLPDIVFMLLFFFMVVTVMREDNLLIENRLPVADQIEKLDKKNPISYVYAGKPAKGYEKFGTEARLQLNDKFAEITEIQAFINAERAALREELVPYLTVSLKVDRDANMGIVGDIKQELRKANALKINYTTGTGSAMDN
ncbi:biopolymer transporter ExbD [Psychroserpens sp.]|uniref:ExbD/TolR family protein n=1 Tax=Psychroserpens sp. TaxID=2020870 RepID=UPI001B0E7AC6|nr:biopolymer transporter ExbD [Psychroserpens sp.]MBO6607787.1 biopolymer transporter ExbD [Psychroserpens sp.]MBO6630317.1 biopolymer transporter ExbD [Psychroserpens sp.]MBO6654778.1 biopolymer transporter ExbD [Psychroserpens sp.]MBO6682798.1 biopolymer transporter ExbD [Psychroserpens sp.]MBO6751145.1 biopolymer transporter ExbD [Psychroserpens sp.]